MSNIVSHRPLPVGIEFFHQMIERKYYYVDKTLLIKDMIDNMSQVTLFTRHRYVFDSLNDDDKNLYKFFCNKVCVVKGENKNIG